MLSIERVFEAREIMDSLDLKTPIVETALPTVSGNIFLKCENLQKTGSFKLRGATYFISQIPDEDKDKGVVAWSAGNHAQGVAKAAQLQGIPATIFIPITGSLTKIENTRSYGAEVILSNGLLDVASQDALAFANNTGAVVIPPYDHDDIIAGQATVALEILEQVADVDAVIVPIGGGGLIAGVAYAIKQIKPNCKVYGVEAVEAASTFESLKHDEIIALKSVNTIADGIAVKSPGLRNFELIRQYVDDIITVTDDEISDAILELMEKNHLIVEGAGAASYAAMRLGKLPAHDNTVCILSGGNLDVNLLNKIVQKSLRRQNRILELTLELEDRPGALLEVIEIIADHDGNILKIDHIHSNKEIPIKHCIANIEFEMTSINNLINLEEVLLNTFGNYLIK